MTPDYWPMAPLPMDFPRIQTIMQNSMLGVECEPLGDAGAVKSLISNALALGRARGWKHVEFRGGRKCFAEAPASLSFYSHTVDLAADEDALFARVEPSVRRAVRKAEKEGLTDILNAVGWAAKRRDDIAHGIGVEIATVRQHRHHGRILCPQHQKPAGAAQRSAWPLSRTKRPGAGAEPHDR